MANPLEFASLGSGSRGNASLVRSGRTQLLIDCGFSRSETEARLERLGVTPDQLAAIVVTHEHSDHISGVARLARRYQLPVWLSVGTSYALRDRSKLELNFFCGEEEIVIGDLCLRPFAVPHDAREPYQLLIDDGASRLALLTDCGSITPHVRAALSGCHGLMLESNYDPQMLERGPYPESLKRRVASRVGHLSNAQAAALLAEIDISNLRQLVALHISEKNNRPELVQQSLSAVLGCSEREISVADQRTGFGWRSLTS